MVDHYLKKFLLLFLLILPFQGLPRTFFTSTDSESYLLKAVNYSDEIITLMSLPVLLLVLLTSSRKIPALGLGKFVGGFIIVAMFSMLINQVPLLQGFFGIYDVLKNILPLYIFLSLVFTRDECLRFISKLRYVGLLLAVIGIIAEAMALFWGMGIGYFVRDEQRLGFYRVTSLTGHGSWNSLGMYAAFVFFLIFASARSSINKMAQLSAMVALIVLTFSRQAWVAFGVVSVLVKRGLLPIGIITISFAMVMGLQLVAANPEEFSQRHYRTFGLLASVELFKEQPILGVGPGRFGGLASVLFDSPFYKQWPDDFRAMIQEVHNIDQFWPSLLAELGIVGFGAYVSIWVAVFLLLREVVRYYRARGDEHMFNVGKVLSCFLIGLSITGLFSGLNAAFVVFTYFSVVGMYLSEYFFENNERFIHQ
jgi:hypothetical protein